LKINNENQVQKYIKQEMKVDIEKGYKHAWITIKEPWSLCPVPVIPKPTFINDIFISTIEGVLKLSNNNGEKICFF
jgi:hypothetical protein